MRSTSVQHDAFVRTRHFPSLDGLRCIAIVGVIWYHCAHSHGVLNRGYLGVDLFFVISGFLISTLLIREKEGNSQISLRNFYIRRTLRIFPLYYLVLGVYVVLVLEFGRGSAREAAFFNSLPFYLTYTSNWFLDINPGTPVIFYFAWSLATEEQFYAVWPWVVRFTRTWRGPTLFASCLLILNQLVKIGVSTGYLNDKAIGVRILSSIATPICLGCLAAYLLHERERYRLAYMLAGKAWSSLLAAALMVLALASWRVPRLFVHIAMTYLVVTCCIRPDHLLRFVLANSVIRYIGTISYGMYLMHMLALNAVAKILPQWGWGAFFAASLALTIALASASYWFFERPILRLKELFRGHPTPTVASTDTAAAAKAAPH